MAQWTEQILTWSEGAEVYLGVPTYSDAGVEYHYSYVENLENALLGIHSGLTRFESLPETYRGLSIYCEWETDPTEWGLFQEAFLMP